MFRRQTSSTDRASDTALEERSGRSARSARHSRRVQRREAADSAAMKARIERVHRRLAEVAEVAVPRQVHAAAIDSDTARADPSTRPFPVAFGTGTNRRPRTIGRGSTAQTA